MTFEFRSIATVKNSRSEIVDDHWSGVSSTIILDDDVPETSLDAIDDFSHLEIFYVFHGALNQNVVLGSEHPRENKNWPRVGIFAQRKKNRLNYMGATIVELVRREGKRLFVKKSGCNRRDANH